MKHLDDDQHKVPPTIEEWSALMDAEHIRQVEHGYDAAHDAEHGIAHLVNWAIDYARRGKNLEAATMMRQVLKRAERNGCWCGFDHRYHDYDQDGNPFDVRDQEADR